MGIDISKTVNLSHVSPLYNNNLVFIQTEMPLWVHWDCETLGKSKTEESCFEKVSPQLGG